ncbi:MAG: hypothetical protein ACPL8I_04635 [Chloroflexaceae bacterium]
MGTTYVYHGYAMAAQYFKQLASETGQSVKALIDAPDGLKLLDFLLDYSFPAPGQLHADFRGGAAWDVQFDPQTYTVTQVVESWNGEAIDRWSGSMSVEQFLSEDWPADTVYGSVEPDMLNVEHGICFGGPGNDIIELDSDATAYGQEGVDAFDLSFYGGEGDHLTIADYQAGEKILFPYDTFDELVAAFQGVSNVTDNGFTANFGGAYGPHWSLTIIGTPLDQMNVADLLVGETGNQVVYGPPLSELGLI